LFFDVEVFDLETASGVFLTGRQRVGSGVLAEDQNRGRHDSKLPELRPEFKGLTGRVLLAVGCRWLLSGSPCAKKAHRRARGVLGCPAVIGAGIHQ